MKESSMAKLVCSRNCFSFWSVGQGLFYTGELNFRFTSEKDWKVFNFLYDVGSFDVKYKKIHINRLEEIVTKLPIKQFNLAFISHFHEDHVNGLKYLKEKGIKIKRIMVPYVDQDELLLLLASMKDPSEWYLSFIVNPYKWILDELEVEVLYILKGGSGEPFVPSSEVPEDPNDYNKDIIEDIIEAEEREKELKILFQNNSDLINKYQDKVKICKQGSSFRAYGLWRFLPFNLTIDKEKLENFMECVKKEYGTGNVNDIFKKLETKKTRKTKQKVKNNKSELKELKKHLKKCYEKFFGGGNKLNLTSLVLYHQPIVYNDTATYHEYFIRGEGCSYNEKFLYQVSGNALIGQFLLGDINLTKDKGKDMKYKNFKDFYQGYLKRSFLSLVPHHGSKDNWRKDFLDDFSSKYWIVSAGKQNSHGHPAPETIYDICSKGKCPIWVHEEWKENRLLIEQKFLCWFEEREFSVRSFLQCWQDLSGEDLIESIRKRLSVLKWILDNGKANFKETNKEGISCISKVEKLLDYVDKCRVFDCI